ncbi:uncharacterized protein BO88DRAFT_456071 [Aspergillus vadensis CBS 113365]|uniref:Uncharacterized protein n=1 Tax=Aspergillus vadensis (strain CBS 113365 / IMI 142717 / IBT 24658) TaxID=1448311 RepID=A0A319B1X8_ASPVC|nr:hypothetical protein BO88DRAFT_456071 [Aspergillus vadensis CBS 113365]PYH66667.1 hypothetical protein BO88DRAFT_456071 [Aspergillus vadensis CBS 113365]
MGSVRSLVTAIAVVVRGVVFQNKMTAANGALPDRLCGDNALARKSDGDLAASNAEKNSGLKASEQVAVRETYFRALGWYGLAYEYEERQAEAPEPDPHLRRFNKDFMLV